MFISVSKLEFDCDVSHKQRKLRARGDRARHLPRMTQPGAVETNLVSVVANVVQCCQPSLVNITFFANLFHSKPKLWQKHHTDSTIFCQVPNDPKLPFFTFGNEAGHANLVIGGGE